MGVGSRKNGEVGVGLVKNRNKNKGQKLCRRLRGIELGLESEREGNI